VRFILFLLELVVRVQVLLCSLLVYLVAGLHEGDGVVYEFSWDSGLDCHIFGV